MTDSFYVLFGVDDLATVPLNYFIEFRKYCTTRDELNSFVERVDSAALNRFSLQLLESVIKLLDDFEGYHFEEISYRRSKILMQIFLHLAGKSLRFRGTVVVHSVAHWTMLLRLEFVRTEALMSLTFLCRHMYRTFLSDDSFMHLLSDLATWWNQATLTPDQRNYISDCFKTLLAEEYLFLQQCHSSIDKDSFLDILFMTESLMVEPSVHNPRKKIKFDPSNIRFCVDYFEQLDKEFADVSLEFLFRAQSNHSGLSFAHVHTDIGLRMFLLATIISAAALRRPYYDDSLHFEQRAIRLICGVLKVLLEVEEIRRRELEAQKAQKAILSKSKGYDADISQTTTVPETSTKVLEMPASLSVDDDTPEKSNSISKSGTSEKILARNTNNNSNSSDNFNISGLDSTSAKNSGGDIVNEANDEKIAASATISTPSPVAKITAVMPRERHTSVKKNNTANGHIAPALTETAFKTTSCNRTPSASSSMNDSTSQCCLRSSNQLRLVLLKRQIAANVATGLREVCVRAIGNLCATSSANQQVAGAQLNAIHMLLRCAMKVDAEKPLIPQKAIYALKMLCTDCVENQGRLLSALELTGNIVDRPQLLANMGFKAEIEHETGKIIRLSPLSANENVQYLSSSSPSNSSDDGECAMEMEGDADDDDEDEEEAEEDNDNNDNEDEDDDKTKNDNDDDEEEIITDTDDSVPQSVLGKDSKRKRRDTNLSETEEKTDSKRAKSSDKDEYELSKICERTKEKCDTIFLDDRINNDCAVNNAGNLAHSCLEQQGELESGQQQQQTLLVQHQSKKKQEEQQPQPQAKQPQQQSMIRVHFDAKAPGTPMSLT